MIAVCEQTHVTAKDWDYLVTCPNPLYLGVDVGRKRDLTVLDLGEGVDGVVHDRGRVDRDPELRADLSSVRREITAGGNLRFDGDLADGHCDRF